MKLAQPAGTRHSIFPAFARPVGDAQQCFRAALVAMSEPGCVRRLPAVVQAPAGMSAGLYALCLSLFDAETPVWLSPRFEHPAIRANLSFHCGCPFVEQREAAAFALLDESDLGDLSGFDVGSHRYPDRSCTLLVRLDSLEGGARMDWRGPGIADTHRMTLPLPEGFWRQRTARSDFPSGLDCFFTVGEYLVGLPRSTRVAYPIEEVV